MYDNRIQIDSVSIEFLANGTSFLRVVNSVKERFKLDEGSNIITLKWSSGDCAMTAESYLGCGI